MKLTWLISGILLTGTTLTLAQIPKRPPIPKPKESSETFKYDQKDVPVPTGKTVRITYRKFKPRVYVGLPGAKTDSGKSVNIKDGQLEIAINSTSSQAGGVAFQPLLISALQKTDAFTLIEPSVIDRALASIDPNQLTKTLQSSFNIAQIITGTVMKTGGTYQAALRMYDTVSGEVFSSVLLTDPDLQTLMTRAARQLAQSSVKRGWRCRIVSEDEGLFYINAGTRDHIQKNDYFMLYRKGKTILDPDTKEVLGTTEKRIGYVEVVEVIGAKLASVKIDQLDSDKQVTVGDLVVTWPDPLPKTEKEKEAWKRIFGDKDPEDYQSKGDRFEGDPSLQPPPPLPPPTPVQVEEAPLTLAQMAANDYNARYPEMLSKQQAEYNDLIRILDKCGIKYEVSKPDMSTSLLSIAPSLQKTKMGPAVKASVPEAVKTKVKNIYVFGTFKGSFFVKDPNNCTAGPLPVTGNTFGGMISVRMSKEMTNIFNETLEDKTGLEAYKNLDGTSLDRSDNKGDYIIGNQYFAVKTAFFMLLPGAFLLDNEKLDSVLIDSFITFDQEDMFTCKNPKDPELIKVHTKVTDLGMLPAIMRQGKEAE
jgi:hypothetical protein